QLLNCFSNPLPSFSAEPRIAFSPSLGCIVALEWSTLVHVGSPGTAGGTMRSGNQVRSYYDLPLQCQLRPACWQISPRTSNVRPGLGLRCAAPGKEKSP